MEGLHNNAIQIFSRGHRLDKQAKLEAIGGLPRHLYGLESYN